MDSSIESIIDISHCANKPVALVGGKGKNLGIAFEAGYKIPEGFCITSQVYFDFLSYNNLETILNYELYRKPFDQMRWEELWDISLRIRAAFIKSQMPESFYLSLLEKMKEYPEDTFFSVRSSATEEDTRDHSFAGIHDSFINVSKLELLEKIILVWTSLWSDRSLLYRKEKSLHPKNSGMSVLIQKMVYQPISGLAFTQNPLSGNAKELFIESITDTLDQLVDNQKEPESLTLDKQNGLIISSTLVNLKSFFSKKTLSFLYEKFLRLEKVFGYPVDIEWTGLDEELTILQVRPITYHNNSTLPLIKEKKDRQWYLSLTPSENELIELTNKIEKILLPDMVKDISTLPKLDYDADDSTFMLHFSSVGEIYEKWKAIYWSDFIPYAHGIRHFGQYYNDLIKPNDPFEFIDLLKNEPLLAKRRNSNMQKVAKMITASPELSRLISNHLSSEKSDFFNFKISLAKLNEVGNRFLESFEKLLKEDFTIFYENNNFLDHPEMILSVLHSLAKVDGIKKSEKNFSAKKLENDYLRKAGKNKKKATLWLKIGRSSWKLRDDDNILLATIEERLWEFIKEAKERLIKKSLLKKNVSLSIEKWKTYHQALSFETTILELEKENQGNQQPKSNIRPRQLIGQPSSPGSTSGSARIIKEIADFKKVIPGEILIFDAVQPQMTFIISLAGGIIERRGGMLVHSSIIARELGIPAVNGVSQATELIKTGDQININGDVGIIVINH